MFMFAATFAPLGGLASPRTHFGGGSGPSPRLGVPLPQRENGRREPERRGHSGLRGRTPAPHTPAERPRNAPGLQLSAEQRAASNSDSDARRPWSSALQQVQQEIGRREPEHRGPSGLRDRTPAPHTPA
ncbi:uncharacterized protein [Bos indicus]|uniref:Uncharacterized protein isoform X2 n=1 Tax=Bos indicus TaxID=9915 RepID=A0ABM4SJT0_BOSIN